MLTVHKGNDCAMWNEKASRPGKPLPGVGFAGSIPGSFTSGHTGVERKCFLPGKSNRREIAHARPSFL